jgi:hypothetical protein
MGLDCGVLRAGEGQQALDQPLESLVDRQQVAAKPTQVVGRPVAPHREFDHRPGDGKRRAQFVGCIRDEPPLSGERTVESANHRVEGVCEPLHLVVGSGQPNAFLQPVIQCRRRRDATRCVGDTVQRGQHPAGHQPCNHHGDHRHGRHGDGPVHQQRRDSRRVDLGSLSCHPLLDGRPVGRRSLAPHDDGAGSLGQLLVEQHVRGGEQDRAGDAEQHAAQDGNPHAQRNTVGKKMSHPTPIR